MIISQTPLRVSLVGGGTDFEDFYSKYGGAVISATINKYIYVIVKERFDHKIGCFYNTENFTSEIVDNIVNIKHDLIRECAVYAKMTNGFDVVILSDAPADGSGLGSSSSMTVGLLNTFYTYRNTTLTQQQLAENACHVEINILKKPIGKQDQYAAAFGGLHLFTFGKPDLFKVNNVDYTDQVVNIQIREKLIDLNASVLRNLEENLLLYFTNITRKAGSILNEQKNNIDSNIENLKELTKLTHQLFEELVKNNNIEFVGEIINKSWMIKQKFASGINNNEIENLWKLAMGNGASGGKISGAGGGGFLILYCKKANQDQLRKALKDYYEFPFMFEQSGSKIIFNQSRQRIK